MEGTAHTRRYFEHMYLKRTIHNHYIELRLVHATLQYPCTLRTGVFPVSARQLLLEVAEPAFGLCDGTRPRQRTPGPSQCTSRRLLPDRMLRILCSLSHRADARVYRQVQPAVLRGERESRGLRQEG